MSHIQAFAYRDFPSSVSADDVWSHLIDIDRRPELIKRIQSIERLDGSKAGSPLRVGSKYLEKAGDTTAPGRSYKAEATVTEISYGKGSGSAHGAGSAAAGMKSASACTADLDSSNHNDNDNDGNETVENNNSADAGTELPMSLPLLPFPRTLAISMVEVNSHRRATATYTVEALPDNSDDSNPCRCRLLSTLAIVPNGWFGRIMFLFLSCCINRSMTADLFSDLEDIAEYFSEEERTSTREEINCDGDGDGDGDGGKSDMKQ